MLYCPSGNTIRTFIKLIIGQENTMGQYRLWLHYRAIEQNLQKQHKTHKQELSEIDEQIARLGKTAMPTDNVLLTMLMQQLKLQEHTTYNTTGVQPEHNGTPLENANGQKYQTPPPSNYGIRRTTDPSPLPQPPHVSPGLLAWGHLPNFATQDIHIPEEHLLSGDAIPISPATTDRLPNDLTALLDQEPQHRQLPWWLRNLMQPPHEEQEPQQTTPIDQQSRHTNQRVEHWFARRTRLVHFDK
jgi:hypothetical protein